MDTSQQFFRRAPAADRYFEEFLEELPGGIYRGLGVRLQDGNPDGRALGYHGLRKFAVTETLTLRKGHREVSYRATPDRPLRVRTMLQRLEGRRD